MKFKIAEYSAKDKTGCMHMIELWFLFQESGDTEQVFLVCSFPGFSVLKVNCLNIE